MLKKYVDTENKFMEIFNTDNGFYIRTGVIEDGKDTDVDPFMRNFPQLLDIGIMQHCDNAPICPVGCYQGGMAKTGPDMTLDLYKLIIDQSKNKVFQCALGGLGDPNQHEYFEEILEYTRKNEIVPNYTTSGIHLTDKQVAISAEFCGAVAVSDYQRPFTTEAIRRFITAGCKTSIHFVLSNSSIDRATNLIETQGFPEGINAVVFLLHKPVGLGSPEDVLVQGDPRVTRFFNAIDSWDGPHSIGFDACSICGIVNNTKNISHLTIDYCEAGRHSAYISSTGIMVPCSFDFDRRWGVDITKYSMQEAWNSPEFDAFRTSFRESCPSCTDRHMCGGGCPLVRDISLCTRPERTIYDGHRI